ncbi:MAG: metalloregulator ArsR/SmtB family transcription factor [Rhodococcus sp.]|nr:metalloregulator ArsR/SmtB family transcription factor [Rhodococcus sp. (in: high G+C Gram-positive bacteria)]
MPTSTETLLAFFKALADTNRLRIIGLLAGGSYTVDELATELGLGASTTSHHLKRLWEVGLVAAIPRGYYRYYELREDSLKDMATRLLGSDELTLLADRTGAHPSTDPKTLQYKVMRAFTDGAGRITAFPVQAKKHKALMEYVATAFEHGTRYTEQQVNTILERFNEDVAYMRRSLVDLGFMDREGGGGLYWLV